ncbi:MAG: oxidative damage protection protein [Acidobacteria bacterium]|nr:MAG: oxidative damage protection protein [Acidobacteriota bacterium]
MARMVKCVKLGKELEGLDKPPWPGDLGRRVYENVSKEAWMMWLEEAKKLINETRLDPTTASGQQLYAQAMERYFFGPPPSPSPTLKVIS